MSASDTGQGTSITELPAAVRAERRALLATCVAAAAKAADVIRDGTARRTSLTWESKGQFDFVSDVDRAAEAALSEVVFARHREATILAEEGSPTASALQGLVFVADPLDGTTNFLHGLPWYAVSIAALIDGDPVAGVVINAATGELYSATLGGGARRGGAPMHVSTTTDPSRALIATGFPFSRDEEIGVYLPLLPAIMCATSGIRRCGAAALDLADVACGRYEAFFELRLNAWDMAAGALLVREAGGIVTRIDGSPCPVAETSMLAGSPAMHAWLLRTLTEAR
jgi:myo-inositol-1(or 4)-monophosphatase